MHILNWYHWLIVVLPIISIVWLALYVKKYSRGVADYLSAGRVAGRYVISVADLMGSLCVISIVAGTEIRYPTGFAVGFWYNVLLPLNVFLGLCGWVAYRFRECKALSGGQFLELRYSRRFRIIATCIRVFSEMLTNCIGPAVAARFFIYMLGLPQYYHFCGLQLSTFVSIMVFCVGLCLAVTLSGGRISLIVTDCVQGLMTYPIFLILTAYIMYRLSWSSDIAPVLCDRVAGESFINPYDVNEVRDFNMFALVASILGAFFWRVWLGNDTSTAARSAHEQKMAGLLGTWRGGFSGVMTTLLVLLLIVVMNADKFSAEAHSIRQQLSAQVAEEVLKDSAKEQVLNDKISQIPVQVHVIGKDAPLSRETNLETPYMDTARAALQEINAGDEAQGNQMFQQYRSLYNQMMLPVALRNFFPPVLIAVLILLAVTLMLTTDDSRIFNSASTLIQDLVIPFFKTPPTPEFHVRMIKILTVIVGLIFIWGSMFLSQLDYLNLFLTIAVAIWTAGAGAVITFGLYSKKGTTAGAYASLISAGLISGGGMLIQRMWAVSVVPWLMNHGLAEAVRHGLAMLSMPFKPWIDWDVPMLEGSRAFVVKFPINSTEISFIATAAGILCYWIVSWLDHAITKRPDFNLERMLHRGIYSDNPDAVPVRQKFTLKRLMNYLVCITPEYSLGDKIIAWSMFIYSIVYKFFFAFIGVLIWNGIARWSNNGWNLYFYWTNIVIPCIAAVITTVWFLWGGIKDMRQLFIDLDKRIRDDLDNGMVEGNVSLSDKAIFAEREAKK